MTGDGSRDTRSYTQVNEHTTTFANKSGGKTSSKIVVAADGKSRSDCVGNRFVGKKVTDTAVYDKQ